MSIVVTAATGHLGRLIVEALLRDGTPADQIVAGGRDLEKVGDLADRGVAVAVIDYNDPDSMAAAFAGADSLMLVSSGTPGNRVAEHAAAIDAAKAAGITHIVYTSAPAATTSELALAPEHKGTEEYLQASGIPFTVLRNNWYTENYTSTAKQAIESGVLAASVGDGRVASASRADYADAAAVVLTQGGHENATYELSGDTAWDFTELAAVISEISGTPVTYERLSPGEYRASLVAAGLPEGTADFVVSLDCNIRDGLLAVTTGDLSRLIGRPTTPLREGLAATL